MFKIQYFDNISVLGITQFSKDLYTIGRQISEPDAIILRSKNIFEINLPSNLLAVGRAGVGVNNIPVKRLTSLGIPVFNAPGANSNAVKELVLAALLISSRNICQARDYIRDPNYSDDDLKQKFETSKKLFSGFELQGKTLGVVGLGSIGTNVANSALALGMKVIGFDPKITVKNTRQLLPGVEKVEKLEKILVDSDAITLHIPLTKETKYFINSSCFNLMKKNSILINFARGEVVDNKAVTKALGGNILQSYVCDFPTSELISNEKVIALPHLGASTFEAEENCAHMVVKNVKNFLENGNIRNSVNFPDAILKNSKLFRLAIANRNVPNMVGQISTILANDGYNIEDLLNQSLGTLAYTLVDLNKPLSEEIIDKIKKINGVLSIRNVGKPLS